MSVLRTEIAKTAVVVERCASSTSVKAQEKSTRHTLSNPATND